MEEHVAGHLGRLALISLPAYDDGDGASGDLESAGAEGLEPRGRTRTIEEFMNCLLYTSPSPRDS